LFGNWLNIWLGFYSCILFHFNIANSEKIKKNVLFFSNREDGNDSHCKYLISTMAAGNVTAVLLTGDERRVLVAISGGPIKVSCFCFCSIFFNNLFSCYLFKWT
jgi:hypothetical protein